MEYPIASEQTSLPGRFRQCDAFVVGGGPSGLAAGIALRQKGMDVVVADALAPPIDKACGEGLMPDSRRELSRLGIDINRELGYEFAGIRFASQNCDRQSAVTADFATGKGVGIRRIDLHQLLIDRAREIGVHLQWGKRVDFTSSPDAIVGDTTYRYRYLVGADGEASRVRRWAGLETGILKSERYGFRRHFRIPPWSNYVEVHWGQGCQAYVTPVGENEVSVAAISRQRGVHFDQVLAQIPWLQAKLYGCDATDRDRGAVTTSRRLKCVTRGNIALIGDASGSADAITGEGLAMVFRQALLLAESLGHDSLAHYEAEHARILKLPQRMASVMMIMDRHDWFRDRVLRMLARNPGIFARMLAVHIGEDSLPHFLMTTGYSLLWRLLIADIGRCKSPAFHHPQPDGDFQAKVLQDMV